MSKSLKYEKPRLINLSSAEWEIGAGYCSDGSGPNQDDPSVSNCVTGPRAESYCNSGGNFGSSQGSSY